MGEGGRLEGSEGCRGGGLMFGGGWVLQTFCGV